MNKLEYINPNRYGGKKYPAYLANEVSPVKPGEVVMKVLMSRENKAGRKLEELCQDMIDDLTEKNLVLIVQMNIVSSTTAVGVNIRNNNELIIAMLKTAIEIQTRTMDLLQKTYGEDKGPENPRI